MSKNTKVETSAFKVLMINNLSTMAMATIFVVVIWLFTNSLYCFWGLLFLLNLHFFKSDDD